MQTTSSNDSNTRITIIVVFLGCDPQFLPGPRKKQTNHFPSTSTCEVNYYHFLYPIAQLFLWPGPQYPSCCVNRRRNMAPWEWWQWWKIMQIVTLDIIINGYYHHHHHLHHMVVTNNPIITLGLPMMEWWEFS